MSGDGEPLRPDQQSDYLLVGRIIKPHGLKGEVKVYPLSQQPGGFDGLSHIALGLPETGPSRAGTIVQQRPQGKVVLIRLAGVTSLDAAEPLVGSGIWVKKSDLPPLAEDEYYWHELEGMRVRTVDGRDLGTVVSLIATGAHDIMVVQGQGREYLIPVVDEIIQQQNAEEQTLVIAPPPGLLDINE